MLAPMGAGRPDEVTTSLRIMRIPPIPEVPEPVRETQHRRDRRGRPSRRRSGGASSSAARAGSEMDTSGRMPSEVLVHLHMDPEARAWHVTSTCCAPRRRGCRSAA